MDTITLSLRGNPTLFGIFKRVQEYRPLLNRTELFREGLDFASSSDVDWRRLAQEKLDFALDDSGSPAFIQLKVESSKWEKVIHNVKHSFDPPLKRTATTYVVKLVMINYYEHLSKPQESGTADSDVPVDIPEMAKIFAELCIQGKNSSELKEINRILMKWRSTR